MEEKKIGKTVVRLVREDPTLLEVDAFVFYARPTLKLGSGFGNAIAVRGGPSVQQELDRLGPAEVGQAVVTGAGKLKAKKIIHAVGPAFQESDTEGKLRRTVQAVLERAREMGARTLALPPMGSGFYGVPSDLSARVCLEEIGRSLKSNSGSLREVLFCLCDPRDTEPFRRRLAELA